MSVFGSPICSFDSHHYTSMNPVTRIVKSFLLSPHVVEFSMELAFRRQLLEDWTNELDRAIRYDVTTRVQLLLSSIIEVTNEIQCLEAWPEELDLFDAVVESLKHM